MVKYTYLKIFRSFIICHILKFPSIHFRKRIQRFLRFLFKKINSHFFFVFFIIVQQIVKNVIFCIFYSKMFKEYK